MAIRAPHIPSSYLNTITAPFLYLLSTGTGGATLFLGFFLGTLILSKNLFRLSLLFFRNLSSAPNSLATSKSFPLCIASLTSLNKSSFSAPTSQRQCARLNKTSYLSSSSSARSKSFFISSGSSPALKRSKNSSLVSQDASFPNIAALQVPIVPSQQLC